MTEAEIDAYVQANPFHIFMEENLRPEGKRYVPRVMFYPPPDVSWFIKGDVHSDQDAYYKYMYTDPEELFLNARFVHNHQV